MRVNIFGRGICPVLGGLLPKRNVEVSAVQLESIIGPKVSVLDIKTGTWITRKNLKLVVNENFVATVAKEPEQPKEKVVKNTRKSRKQVEEVSAIVETVEPVVFEEEKVAEAISEPMEEVAAETETEATLEAETEESNDTESSEGSDVNETNHYHGKKNKKRNK